MRVLVTGMSGLIGSALKATLTDGYQCSALNRSDVPGVLTTRASLDSFEAIRPAFVGQDVVIHLAAKIHDGYGWDELLATNVVGTRNVLEAATQAGVRRVIMASSSGATVAGWELQPPYAHLVAGEYDQVVGEIPLIDETMATRPRNLYASTKVWGEAIGRHYADNHGLEVVCLRIGYANAEDRPVAARDFSVWNSQRDVVRAIHLAMTMPMTTRFDVFFILSDNRYGYRSLARAKRVLGFIPMDAAEHHREKPVR
jgi:NAD+ dependent glucose-6-phosphate dehydrogenase